MANIKSRTHLDLLNSWLKASSANSVKILAALEEDQCTPQQLATIFPLDSTNRWPLDALVVSTFPNYVSKYYNKKFSSISILVSPSVDFPSELISLVFCSYFEWISEHRGIQELAVQFITPSKNVRPTGNRYGLRTESERYTTRKNSAVNTNEVSWNAGESTRFLFFGDEASDFMFQAFRISIIIKINELNLRRILLYFTRTLPQW